MKIRTARSPLALVVSLALAVSLSAAGVTPPAVAAVEGDRDNDGIPDKIEAARWYKKKGGDPDRQDIWVECDYMRTRAPTAPQRKEIVANLQEVFDRAPVDNPNGETGIAFHMTYQDQIPFEVRWGDLQGGFDGYVQTRNKLLDRRAKSFNGKPFGGKAAKTMKPYIYYCAVINSVDIGGVSGIAMDSSNVFGGVPGDMFIIALGQWPDHGSVAQHTGTLLHELGHAINLRHGGGTPGQDSNHKPNYLSVMNYHFQTGFIRETEESFGRFDYWDFSTFKAKTLDERRMNESKGIRAPEEVRSSGLAGMRRCGSQGAAAARAFLFNTKVDWNCNGQSDGVVEVDVNKDGVIERLGGWNDWEHLVLGSTAAVTARVGAPGTRSTRVDPGEELDLQTSLEIDAAIRRSRVPVQR